MKKRIARAVTYCGAAVFVIVAVMMAGGPAMAQTPNACVYANDDLQYDDGGSINTVEGYLVTAAAQTYISPFQTGGKSSGASLISDIAFSPTKNNVYAADSYSGDIAVMRADPTTCQLTLIGNYPVGFSDGGGIGLVLSPDGKRLYAAGVHSAQLNVLAVGSDGGLTGIRQEIALLNRPASLAISPDGETLIVGIPKRQNNGVELASYSIDPTSGRLALVSTVSPHGSPWGISIDSQSKFVYVYELSSAQLRIGLMEIGPGGALTFLRTYNFPEVEGSLALGSVLLSRDGGYLYVTDYGLASVTVLKVNDVTGALKYLSTTSYGVVNEDRPVGLATSKNGHFVFAGEPDVGFITHMGIFSAKKGGSLTSLGTFPVSDGAPAWVAAK